ncbi:MAG: TetR/AcrR family transcriptional regulator [Clostridia bacterium]
MTTAPSGLRERKKHATRQALRDAALRLALERGPANVRVSDIAEAAGVAPRTYNNYFSSREEAIVAAVTADREVHVAAAVAGRPAHVRLSDAVVGGIVEQYADPGSTDLNLWRLIAAHPSLIEAALASVDSMEDPLTEVIAERLGGREHQVARVLSASAAAAVRIGLQQWLQAAPPSASRSGLVVVSGSLPDLLRAALAPLVPAFDAAEGQLRRRSDDTAADS